MANRVIIVDAHRANERIPFFELKQMMGRVSRGNDTEPGKVDFVLGAAKYENVVADIKANAKYQVKSTLADDIDELAFHINAEISRGTIRTADDISRWYSRSLSFVQGKTCDIPQILDTLQDYGCIVVIEPRLQPTLLGLASARYYLTPARIHSLSESFSEILEVNPEPDTFALAWALANGGIAKSGFEPKEIGFLIEEYKSQISALGLDGTGKILSGMIWWYLLGGPSIKSLRPAAFDARKEWPRLYRALRIINRAKKWPHVKFLIDLNIRICNRIPSEFVPLCRDGFTKTSAIELYNMDVKCYDELQNRLNEIFQSDNPVLIAKVKQVIHEHNNNELRATRTPSVFRGDEE